MENRKNDILYLGCDPDKIKSAHPSFQEDRLRLLYEYITQRQEIYKRRKDGVEDLYNGLQPLFQEFKFTNVRREDDKTTKYLIDNISLNKDFTVSERFWRSFLFRIYNRIDTAEELDLTDPNLWNRSYEKNLELLSSINHDVYTRAFKTIGLRLQLGKYCEDSVKLGPLYFVKSLRESWINNDTEVEYPINHDDQFSESLTADKLYKWFLQFKGIGCFFAYQFFVDMTYIPECPISENEFVISGPGCRRGLEELVSDWDNLSYEEMLFYLRDNLETIFQEEIDKNFSCDTLFDNIEDPDDRSFNVMSLENIFCEFKKYLYVRIYDSRTKRYHPGKI